MKTKTKVIAGLLSGNHNETMFAGLRVKTAVKAGNPPVPLSLTMNHNETCTAASLSIENSNIGAERESTRQEIIAAAMEVRARLLAGTPPRFILPGV